MRRPRSVKALGVILMLAAAAAVAVAAAAVSRQAPGPPLPLKLVANVALPGPSNRFDYTSLDPTTGRLYIAHMNAGQLLVFDIRTRRVVQDDRGARRPRSDRRAAAPSRIRVRHRRAAAVHDRQPHRPRAQRAPPQASTPTVSSTTRSSDTCSSPTRAAESRPSSTRPADASPPSSSVATPATSSTTRGAARSSPTCRSRNQVAVIDPRSNRVVRRVTVAGMRPARTGSHRRASASRVRRLRRKRPTAHARPRDDEGHREHAGR